MFTFLTSAYVIFVKFSVSGKAEPSYLATSTQSLDEAKTTPEGKTNRQKQNSNTMIAALLSPNTGTNNTYPT